MIERFQSLELDERERNVLRHVEDHGWTVMNIREEDGLPGWAFTIGLCENFEHPEVAIFGLQAETRHSILNWIGENVREGKPFAAGHEYDWVIKQDRCWSRAVQKVRYRDLFGWARWFYGGDEFPVVQCLWPAKDGTFPWDATSPFVAQQPLLYEEDLLSARMMHHVDDQKLSEAQWPFAADPHQTVYVSRSVVEGSAPITGVVRDDEGDWRFMGLVDDDYEVSCFHCVVERDPGIRLLARLQPEWEARRLAVGGEWTFHRSEKG